MSLTSSITHSNFPIDGSGGKLRRVVLESEASNVVIKSVVQFAEAKPQLFR